MRIALAGNPNSGKTTMYNALTGSSETVGNWAGVTVEQKSHPIKKIYTNGEEIVKRWYDRSRSESWTTEMREAARQRRKECLANG